MSRPELDPPLSRAVIHADAPARAAGRGRQPVGSEIAVPTTMVKRGERRADHGRL